MGVRRGSALNRWLSVAADVDGQYKTIPFSGATSISHRTRSPAAFAHRRDSVASSSSDRCSPASCAPAARFSALTDTTTQRVVQPGIGFEYPLAASWAISSELDVRFMSTGQEIRVVTGIVRAFR